MVVPVEINSILSFFYFIHFSLPPKNATKTAIIPRPFTHHNRLEKGHHLRSLVILEELQDAAIKQGIHGVARIPDHFRCSRTLVAREIPHRSWSGQCVEQERRWRREFPRVGQRDVGGVIEETLAAAAATGSERFEVVVIHRQK